MSPHHLPTATHAAPRPPFTLTPCCGIPPTELPQYHGVTPDLRAVTCPGNRTSALRELIGIVLTGTQRLGTRRRGFLPHGDEDGHVYDERCALCAGDVRRLADTLAEALIAAFPEVDMRNLRATRAPDRRRQAVHGSPLLTLITVALATTPSPGAPGPAPSRHGAPDGHTYSTRCALCAADPDVLAAALERALTRTLPTSFPAPRRRRSTATTKGAA